MIQIGYHVSHEQFSPTELLSLVVKAEAAGFDFAVASDHFYPWNNAQGQSGFVWSWLGAALSRTSFPIGVVNCPCHRYHPVIIAQAVATLLEMFPSRFWMAAGSGQLLNEGVIGAHWPSKARRNEKLAEAVHVMRSLWRGEEVNHQGHFDVQEAKLYTMPKSTPQLLAAAITPSTAGWAAGWADELITISQPIHQLEKVVEAWKKDQGKDKPMTIKWQVSYDRDEQQAKLGAHEQWRTNVFGSDLSAQLRTPLQFEMAAAHVTPDEMSEYVFIASDPDKYIETIETFHKMGFEKIDIHNVNKKQEGFIDFIGREILPKLKQL